MSNRPTLVLADVNRRVTQFTDSPSHWVAILTVGGYHTVAVADTEEEAVRQVAERAVAYTRKPVTALGKVLTYQVAEGSAVIG